MEEAGLDVEVRVERGVGREESDRDSAKEAVVRIELLVGHASKVLDWRPGFGGKEVVEWELGGRDDAKALGHVEVVCTKQYELEFVKQRQREHS